MERSSSALRPERRIAGEGERQQADQEQDSQDYVEETDSSEFFEHSWFWRYNRRQVVGVTERQLLGVWLLLSSGRRVSTCFNTALRHSVCGRVRRSSELRSLRLPRYDVKCSFSTSHAL